MFHRSNGGTLGMGHPQKRPLKGDIPKKYPLYQVYMGFILKGPPSQGCFPPLFPMSFYNPPKRDPQLASKLVYNLLTGRFFNLRIFRGYNPFWSNFIATSHDRFPPKPQNVAFWKGNPRLFQKKCRLVKYYFIWPDLWFQTHRIHGTNGIFTIHEYHKHQLNIGKFTSPMDPFTKGHGGCQYTMIDLPLKKLTLQLRWLVLTSAKYHGLHGKPNKQHYRSWPWPISTLDFLLKNGEEKWAGFDVFIFGVDMNICIYLIYPFFICVFFLIYVAFWYGFFYMGDFISAKIPPVIPCEVWVWKEFRKRPGWHPSNSPEQWSVHRCGLGHVGV